MGRVRVSWPRCVKPQKFILSACDIRNNVTVKANHCASWMPNCAAVESREGNGIDRRRWRFSKDAKFFSTHRRLRFALFNYPACYYAWKRNRVRGVFVIFRRSTLRIKTNSSKYLLFERFLSLFHRRPTFRYAFFRGVVFCSALRSAFARAVQETQATQKSFAYLYKALAPLALHLSLSISNRSL